MTFRRRRSLLELQADSRYTLERAVTDYAALRQGLGQHTAAVDVRLRDGTRAVALLTVELVPDPTA